MSAAGGLFLHRNFEERCLTGLADPGRVLNPVALAPGPGGLPADEESALSGLPGMIT